MQDKHQKKSELFPTWRSVEEEPPPLGVKMLFKPDHGPAVIGVYYQESKWTWWCPLPSHTHTQKEKIKSRSIYNRMIYAHIG